MARACNDENSYANNGIVRMCTCRGSRILAVVNCMQGIDNNNCGHNSKTLEVWELGRREGKDMVILGFLLWGYCSTTWVWSLEHGRQKGRPSLTRGCEQWGQRRYHQCFGGPKKNHKLSYIAIQLSMFGRSLKDYWVSTTSTHSKKKGKTEPISKQTRRRKRQR